MYKRRVIKIKKEELLKKRIGLFICCGRSEQAEQQLEDSFARELLDQAVVKGYFGYEYNLEKMNFFFRLIVKKLAKIEESKSALKEENIKEFAQKLLKS